jgi:ribosomal-protein-serine acetyltransferase
VPAGEILPLDLGDGLVLMATTGADADEAFAVVDAERGRLREWLPWVDGTTKVETEREFFDALAHANATGTGLHTTIRRHGEFSGVAGLRVDLVRRTAEVGYWLAARALGQGVMLRTVAALFDVGFEQLRLHRLELLAALGNVRSRAVAERLGMVFEGVRREAEELPSGFVDLAMYAVLAQDWPGSAAALQRAGVISR